MAAAFRPPSRQITQINSPKATSMIKKAVIPAAGFGTRLLPICKSIPKEMLPVVDKPAIQYIVEEAVASGIDDILIIISRGKRSIEEYFDRNIDLELLLERTGRTEELESIRRLAHLADIHFIWQPEMMGLGDAVKHAWHHVGAEPFALLLGDAIIASPQPARRQLIEVHARHGGCVIGLEQVPPEKTSSYGIIAGQLLADGCYRLDRLVEKPAPQEAPSTLAVAGRYLLTPEIFPALQTVQPGKNGEIQLTDALQTLLQDQPMHGVVLHGHRHDIGNKLDYLKANIVFGLQQEGLAAPLRAFLKTLLAAD
jgi:UTP--glucose-1-phosphate uridylyltransferase